MGVHVALACRKVVHRVLCGRGGHGRGKRPGSERGGVTVVGTAHVHAHACTLLHDITRDGHENSGRMTCDIRIAHLVVATPSERERRRAFGVKLGELGDLLLRDTGDFGGPGERIGFLVLEQQVVNRAGLDAVDLDRSGQTGGVSLVERRNLARPVDNPEQVLLPRNQSGGQLVHNRSTAHNDLAGLLVNQERQ